MKLVTGNRLTDGAVVYLSEDAAWTDDIRRAKRLEQDAEAALAGARARFTEIAGAYLIDIGADGAPTGRETVRETIRLKGPTVRPDLGRKELRA